MAGSSVHVTKAEIVPIQKNNATYLIQHPKLAPSKMNWFPL